MAEETYKIHNKSRFSRFLDGGKITVRRGSPIPITFTQLKKLRTAILAEKNLEVRNSEGKLVNLVTGENVFRDSAPPPAEVPGLKLEQPEQQPPAPSQEPEQTPEPVKTAELQEPLPVIEEPAVAPINSTPNFPLDSVERDTTFEHGVGEHIPVMPGAKGINEAVPEPSVNPPVTSEEDKPVAAGGDPVAARQREKKSKKSKDEG